MPDLSPRLNLPYIAPAQAQKHVTVNEAFRLLDAITQLTVEEFDALDPPPAPEQGQIWSLGPTPTGPWAGQGGHLAIATQGSGWMFILPREGWRAHGKSDGIIRSYLPDGWQMPAASAPAQLGISATPDDTNRLSVSSPATLLNHAGSGHQLKINKAGPSDTASLLFQTNWTGHAEMGLAGGDNFEIKVSENGADWQTGLYIERATGILSGDGIQTTPMGADAGMVLTAGAYGLGKAVSLAGASVDAAAEGGFYMGYGGGHALASGAGNPFPGSSSPFTLQTTASLDGDWTQTAHLLDPNTPAIRIRSKPSGASAGAWADVALQTGSNGSNANGSYIRQADGTQICSIGQLTLSRTSIELCETTWNFPQPFLSGTTPSITAAVTVPPGISSLLDVTNEATPDVPDLGPPLVGAVAQTSAHLGLSRRTGAVDFDIGDKLYMQVVATGRWK